MLTRSKKRKLDAFIRYKKAGSYVVKLEIGDINNENRDGIVDTEHAEYRCKEAKVLDILTVDGISASIEKIASNYDSKFIYRKGECAAEPNWDSNLDVVCSEGIHYFKTFDQAKWYTFNGLQTYTGMCKEWHDNGQMKMEWIYIKGKLPLRATEW